MSLLSSLLKLTEYSLFISDHDRQTIFSNILTYKKFHNIQNEKGIAANSYSLDLIKIVLCDCWKYVQIFYPSNERIILREK